MENNKSLFPVLNPNEQSFEIINAFLPEFYAYLKDIPGASDSLLLLHRNGNEKAGEIIKYLIGNSPLAFTPSNKNNHKCLHQDFWRGSATYNLTWSDFKINDLDKTNIFVEFNFEAFFKEETEYYHIRRDVLIAKDNSTFREQFLLKNVSEEVQKSNYRLRRSKPETNSGLLAPYVHLELTPIDLRKVTEFNNEKDVSIARRVKGVCKIKLLPLV